MKFSAFDFRRWFLFVFAFTLLAINLVAYVFFRKNEELTNSRHLVAHTYQVLVTAEDLFAHVQDMETAQRGYLLSPSASSLQIFEAASNATDTSMTQLKNLTVDNSERQLQLNQYLLLINQQRTLLRQQIAQTAGTSSDLRGTDRSEQELNGANSRNQ